MKELGKIRSAVQPKRNAPVQSLQERSVAQENLTSRQKSILNILTKKDKIQVRDIISEIPSITKRTVRRDLDDLLKRGKITRIGEFNQVFYQKTDGTHFLS